MEIVPPATRDGANEAMAERLPARVRLGTSSWSFSGWRGLVYAASAPAASLASEGLAAYAHHGLHRTVGLDRAFYETPGVGVYRRLAEQVPTHFRFVVKAHQAVTRPHLQSDGTTLGSTVASHEHGAVNPRFLDAAWACDAVVAPAVEGLGAACGPIVFQFPSLAVGPREAIGDESALLDRLAGFLQALPRGPMYAVEFRNPSMLAGRNVERFVQALGSVDAVPGLGLIPSMPAAGATVAALIGAGWAWSVRRPMLIRWLLGHGLGYDEARRRFEPFHEAVAPDPASRDQIAVAVARALSQQAEAYVIVNNKAEGSAPRSIATLAASVLDAMHRVAAPERTETMS